MKIKKMIRIARALALIAAAALSPAQAKAQQVAVKTDVLSDAVLNVNLGAEIGLAPKWTLEAEGELNAWRLSHGRTWKHWALQPELRYWLCNAMDGHFFGMHIHGGQYNIGHLSNGINFLGTDFSKLSDYRFQGWFAGAGVSYGYAWALTPHFNIEAEIGIGWSYTRYDQYRCASCNKKVRSRHPHNYVGPTRAALNLVYVF